MKKWISTTAVALLAAAGAFGQAANGTYQAGGSLGWTNVLDSSGNLLADNSVILYGSFGSLSDTDLANLLGGGSRQRNSRRSMATSTRCFLGRLATEREMRPGRLT